MSKVAYNKIGVDYRISYKHQTQKYGRAEFEFCPCFKYGYLREVFITPRQQPDHEDGWMIKIDSDIKITRFCVSDYSYKQNAKNWYGYYCKHHKTYCMQWYVPSEPCYLVPRIHFGIDLAMEFWPVSICKSFTIKE